MTERFVTHATFTVERSPEGAGTRLVLTEQGAYFDGFDDTGERERGTAELLGALGAQQRRERAASR